MFLLLRNGKKMGLRIGHFNTLKCENAVSLAPCCNFSHYSVRLLVERRGNFAVNDDHSLK